MSNRELVRTRKRKLCAGDLNHFIFLKDRQLGEPGFDPDTGLLDVDFVENFGVDKNDGIWAGVKTVTGKVIFDGTGTDQITITHEFLIYFDAAVTTEVWIQDTDGKLFDIIRVEDFDERKQYMRLLCVERGLGEAAKA